ncbi:MAG TPA: hypothetical protein VGO45_01415, partial [Bacteroidia bacterium]|nr:hypothetical protein [Bacteroidia bacterium]
LAKLEDSESEASVFRYLSLSKLLGLDKNNWYSLLDGKTGPSGENESENEKIDLVYVDILSKAQETAAIYSGFLFKYYFKPNTRELGYLVLQHVMRRDVRKEHVSYAQKGGKENNTYFSSMGPALKIPGEFFIIPAEQILNVNITYLEIDIPVGS